MNGCKQKCSFIRLFSICGYMATQLISACIEIALQATPSEKEARIEQEGKCSDPPENPVYSMLENAMWVVDENEAKKFLGRIGFYMMVDCVDGFGPHVSSSQSRLFASLLLC